MGHILRVVIKVTLTMIIVLVFLNGTRIWIEERSSVNIEPHSSPEFTNSGEGQGNVFVYARANGIRNAPFIFGESLYLYDIDTKKKHLLKCLKRPLSAFERNMSIRNGKVFFERCDYEGDGLGYLEVMELAGKRSSRIGGLERFLGSYSISDQEIIYVSDCVRNDNGDECEGAIIKQNIATKDRIYIYPPNNEATFGSVKVKNNYIYGGEGSCLKYKFEIETCKYLDTIENDSKDATHEILKTYKIKEYPPKERIQYLEKIELDNYTAIIVQYEGFVIDHQIIYVFNEKKQLIDKF